ncbi:MAG: hypothetical protein R3F37_20400 [Candidatus Competibacteraceae bacterium]
MFAIHDRKMLFVLEDFTEAMIQPLVDRETAEIIAIDGVFQDSDAENQSRSAMPRYGYQVHLL